MKATLYDLKGNKKKDIETPKIFDAKVREDIAAKCFETMKLGQTSSKDLQGGNRYSASGKISHKRHDWKGHYGKGIARSPRKTMWRRGTQFFWVGATTPESRGGRRAHPPKGIGKERKLNKKEMIIAMSSGFAATGKGDFVVKRYSSIDKADIKGPFVIESLDKVKTKDFVAALKKIYGDMFDLVMIKRSVRPGKGKLRGRKYKKSSGLLVVKSASENFKMNGVDVKSVGEVMINDLYPLGRITLYTEKALEEMGESKK